MANFTAVFDPCVLYPAPLRDLLMSVAMTDQFRARWTEDTHNEWILNVLANHPEIKASDLERTVELMNQSVPDCLVDNCDWMINSLELPDLNDRHVLAAAIKDLGDRVHTRWLVDYYRPTQEVMISDEREYSIDVNREEPPQLFIVNLFLNAPSDESKKSIQKGFEDETHIVVKGRAVDVEPVKHQLAPVVAMERGIFTSKIRIKR